MHKVIVSGGNGFIGSSLISRLSAEGCEVHALASRNRDRLDAILPAECIHELKDGPASIVEAVNRVQPDTIFHLAAINAEPTSVQNLVSMLEVNLTLGSCLLFAATQCIQRPSFVNAGTYWQFNSECGYAPNTLYAATKQAFQDLLFFYREREQIPCVTLILHDTFGESDTRRKLWHSIVTCPTGASLRLSGGEQMIHLVHVDDVVDAFLSAATLLHGGNLPEPVYSVHANRPWKLRSLIEQLNGGLELGLDLQWGAIPYREGQIFEPCAGEMVPGWHARVDVLQSLTEMVARHRRQNGPSAGLVLESQEIVNSKGHYG